MPHLEALDDPLEGLKTHRERYFQNSFLPCISYICQLTSLKPVYIGATVAPHTRSLKAKLHTISNPGRRDLMPLLNKPMMTITLDTKRKMLSNNVRRENQLA